MEVIKTAIEGVVIIEPRVLFPLVMLTSLLASLFGKSEQSKKSKDARGYFFESFSQREFDQKVRPINFVQDNESMSSYGVMRGLHFQAPPFTQSKCNNKTPDESLAFLV